ncbi:MAG: hypothetical protein U5K70_08405 [Halodesulfurarchaeum sp.]|nr:hypothetical protein [Halodesulfurarchaeum sp.]
MERRCVLRAAGALALGLTAGCLSDPEPEFQLRDVHRDFGPGPNGNLTVWVTISNPGNERQTGTVYVRTEVNDDSLVRVREVTLEPHETSEIEIGYDVAYENVSTFSMKTSVEPRE